MNLPGTTPVRWAILLTFEALLVVVYFINTTATVDQYRYLLYPFVWINLALWSAVRVRPPRSSRRRMAISVFVAGCYLLLLLTFAGIIGSSNTPGQLSGPRIWWSAPGWGPLLLYDGTVLSLKIVPFEVIGYTVLSYLLYVNTLSALRNVFAGAIGLTSCVSCVTPVLATLIGGIGGISSTTISLTYRWSYDVGTALFAVTVGLLHWANRP